MTTIRLNTAESHLVDRITVYRRQTIMQIRTYMLATMLNVIRMVQWCYGNCLCEIKMSNYFIQIFRLEFLPRMLLLLEHIVCPVQRAFWESDAYRQVARRSNVIQQMRHRHKKKLHYIDWQSY